MVSAQLTTTNNTIIGRRGDLKMKSLTLLGCVLTVRVQAFVSPTISVQSCRPSTSLASSRDVQIVFSDVDGSLVHYPKNGFESSNDDILALPPSATGLKGVISSKTLQLCRDLRQSGIKIVLISSMRTSTLLNRLPFLPRADAYCTEAGGRIFYPTEPIPEEELDESFPFQQWTPEDFTGAEPADLEPFGLREDRKWRKRLELEEAAGMDGYAGNEVSSNRCEDMDDEDEECSIDYENPYGFPIQEDVIPVSEREGALWQFARKLEEDGFVLDTKSYSTCFRVNQKHQSSREKFQALLQGDIGHPPELAKSMNLGCVDFYPVSSGKRNCCQYISDELGIKLASESVCICDDDNDIEMAMACSQAFIPALTSESMEVSIKENPTQFTLTYQADNVTSTLATDAALQLIYDKVSS